MTATAPATQLAIRAFERGDRERIRAIACRTAFRNRGHEVMIDDAELFADYWTRYYTDFEPESAFIAELDGTIVGYSLGCIDTRRFQRVMARDIAPRIVRSLLLRWVRSSRHDVQLRRLMRWLAWHAWRESPPVDLVRFPAHYHLNVERAGYGAGAYSALALRFVQLARRRGTTGMHGQVLDRRDGGVWHGMVNAFVHSHPDVTVVATARESTLARALWADERAMVNRAFAADIDGYETFLLWLRQWRRL